MSTKTHIIKGKARWCKVIGAAPAGYDNGPPEWSFDLILDSDAKKAFVASGADPFYIKTDKKDGSEYVKFVRRAEKKDGTEAQPIRVVDHKNQAWDNRLIGNGSTLNVCYALNEVKSKGTKRLKPSVMSVQVWDWSKFVPKGPFDVKPDTETGAAASEEWNGDIDA